MLILATFGQIVFAETVPDYNKPFAPIYFDQSVYTWTDKVEITIVAPSWNTSANLIDSIGGDSTHAVNIYTSKHQLEQYKLYETDSTSGIFKGEIILTGFSYDVDGDGQNDTNPRTTGSGPNSGYLQIERNSGLTVSFEFADGVVLTESVDIEWNMGHLKLVDVTEDSAMVRLYDRDMNLNPESKDTVNVKVYSENDVAGVNVQAIETDEESGIFETVIQFTKTDTSSGSRLYVLPDSEITAEYTDRTLPEPYTINDELDISAIATIISGIPSNERLVISQTNLLSQDGNTVEELIIDQNVMIFSKIENSVDFMQDFVYIVQIKDENNHVVSLSWISGSALPNQELGVSVSWMPEELGEYHVDKFVWESISSPIALSDPILEKIVAGYEIV